MILSYMNQYVHYRYTVHKINYLIKTKPPNDIDKNAMRMDSLAGSVGYLRPTRANKGYVKANFAESMSNGVDQLYSIPNITNISIKSMMNTAPT